VRLIGVTLFAAGAFATCPSATTHSGEPCGEAMLGFSLMNVDSRVPFAGIIGAPTGAGRTSVRAVEGIPTRSKVYAAVVSAIHTSDQAQICGWTLSIVLEGDAVPTAVSFRESAAGSYMEGGLERNSIVDPAENEGKQGFASLALLTIDNPCQLPQVATTAVLTMEIEERSPHSRNDTEAILRFQDGLRMNGSPRNNEVVLRGEVVPPCNKDTASLTVVFSLDGPRFVRGNADGDGLVDVSDALFILRQLFEESRTATCPAASDTNADGLVDISDAIYLLAHLFQGGPSPAAPFPDCGPDTVSAGESLPCPELPPGCG